MTSTFNAAIGDNAIDTQVIEPGARQYTPTPPTGVKKASPIGHPYVYSDMNDAMLFDATGAPIIEYDYACINQSITNILSTNQGERMMLPTFGSNIPAYVFEACSPYNAQMLQLDIQDALVQWENRITVNNVIVTPNPAQNAFYIYVYYTILLTGAAGVYSAQLQTQPG